jgi:basic amino acid/polyamine antiporter, APA family
MTDPAAPVLARVLSLPGLVFYGVGVTVGAGIFALIGAILGVAGPFAPLSFLVAGLIAGSTAWSYALLVRRFPFAGGEAIYVTRGLGPVAGRIAGLGVVVTGIVSSATIALAFGGYLSELAPVPPKPAAVVLVMLLALVAWRGVRESIMLAAVVTLLETGTLIVVVGYGLPVLADADGGELLRTLAAAPLQAEAILAGAVLAFFAFIGFEDMVNMAEETRDPERTVPRAILVTLAITILIYLLLATIAALTPESAAVASSRAPMATLFENLSGLSGKPVATVSALAMVNGILVQLVMAARVLYGMASDGQLPRILARIDRRRHTPAIATALVAVAVILLAIGLDLARLAELTSLVTLAVFTLVNLSLFMIGTRSPESGIGHWRWWGLAAALPTAGILLWQLQAGAFAGGH